MAASLESLAYAWLDKNPGWHSEDEIAEAIGGSPDEMGPDGIVVLHRPPVWFVASRAWFDGAGAEGRIAATMKVNV
jgi:hypothetical protein